eukprot:2761018-Rhodomonas_salina.1
MPHRPTVLRRSYRISSTHIPHRPTVLRRSYRISSTVLTYRIALLGGATDWSQHPGRPVFDKVL